VRSLRHLRPNDPRRLALEVIDACGIAEPPVDEQVIIEYFRIALSCTAVSAVPGCGSLAAAVHRLSGMLIKDNPDEPPLLWANPEMSRGRFRWRSFTRSGTMTSVTRVAVSWTRIEPCVQLWEGLSLLLRTTGRQDTRGSSWRQWAPKSRCSNPSRLRPRTR
jgi:hypothetical protein